MLPARVEIGQRHKQGDEANSRARWNTPRSDVRNGMSYASRMAASFALTSVMTVAVLVTVVTVVWSGVFTDYTRDNMTEIAQLAAQRLAEAYEADGEWTTEFLASVADSSLVSDDTGMQVADEDGTILYDDSWPAAAIAAEVRRSQENEEAADAGAAEADAGEAEGSAPEGSATVEDPAPADGANPEGDAGDAASSEGSADEGDDDEQAHSLTSSAPTDASASVTRDIVLSDGTVVGQVRLWVLGSDALLSRADTAFRERTFNAMFFAAIIAVAISLIIGFLVSRMLTNPLRRITGTAKQIRDGDLSARTGLRGDDEIDRLGETFDEMATSLEKDLKHERRITSDVAHELRTPLMAMLATVEAMQDGVLPADDEHLETVASETRRLSRLVQQMLDLSRMENRTAPLKLEPVDIAPFVQRIVDSQQQLFQARDLRLRFADDTQGRPATIEVDPDMITQAVINLLSNAMRYTPEGGWVVASVSGDRRYIMISVKDTGIGIAKEDLSRIFGRFWRADASRAREAGGLGVGLSVTKQIVERHHGFISVESELEKGTTFTIHLPREATPEGSSSTIEH
ncbi:sensor histidine kinase [Enorma phocaeensis]|uniref:sensor histidine kinase n=1 Tax=Enorma phocaeensis TaxID=1871019 RepID=UPI000C8154C9|nr:HAMP domain-containing sensor histidine kinase [Enorma phocaeensis]